MFWIATKGNKIVYIVDTGDGEQGILKSLEYQQITDYDQIQSVNNPYFEGTIGGDLREFNSTTWGRKTQQEILTELGKSKLGENEVILFEDGWKVIESYKGKTIYNKENQYQYQELYEHEIPEGWTIEEPIKDKPCKFENNKWVVDISKYKEQKFNEISSAFEDNVMNGHFNSPTLGIEVDCRRGGINNDIQNLERLIKRMNRENILETPYKGYTEEVVATIDQLNTLLEEMGDYGLLLYLKKWQLEEQVKNVNDSELLKDIKWNEE